MTEAEWMVSSDPAAMLQHFATTELPGLLPEYRKLSDRKLRLFVYACTGDDPAWEKIGTPGFFSLADAALYCVGRKVGQHHPLKLSPTGKASRAAILRDIFGNPWRLLWPTASPYFRSLVVTQKIALGIYEERTFDIMPILADALEDAGCDNEDMLRHCRSGGPHVRGCWVLDLILGKE